MKPLTEPQLAAITLYLQGKSQAEIAADLGRSEKTVYTWLHLPAARAVLLDFSENYRKKLAERVDRLQDLAVEAVEEIVTDRDGSPANRLAAARLIFGLCECQKAARSERELSQRRAMVDILLDEIPKADLDPLRDRYGDRAVMQALKRATNLGKAAAAEAMASQIERLIAEASTDPR